MGAVLPPSHPEERRVNDMEIQSIASPATQQAVRDWHRRILERAERQGIAEAIRYLTDALYYPECATDEYSKAIKSVMGAWSARKILSPDECEQPALAEWIARARNAEGERDALRLRVRELEKYEPGADDDE